MTTSRYTPNVKAAICSYSQMTVTLSANLKRAALRVGALEDKSFSMKF